MILFPKKVEYPFKKSKIQHRTRRRNQEIQECTTTVDNNEPRTEDYKYTG